MEKSELLKLLEEVIGQELSPEKIKGILDPVIEERLLGDNVKRHMVMTYDELKARQDQETKRPTFSQYLGDVSRLGRGLQPEHVTGEDIDKWFIPQASEVTPENIRGVLNPEQIKALYSSSDAAGGYLVPTEESRQLIDLTSNWSVVPGLCQQVPMRTNVITVPTLTGGVTAYWIPEASSISAATQTDGLKVESTPTFAQMTITTHVLAILVYVSNQLLDDSDPAVDTLLMNIFGRTLGSYLDLACLAGAGTATDPIIGLDNLITTNSFSAGAIVNYDDVIDLIRSIHHQALGPQTRSAVQLITSPQALTVLMKVKDADGAYLYKDPREAADLPTIWGAPTHEDRNVSITLGGGSDTKMYAGDFANHAYIGNSMNMVVKANPWLGTAFLRNHTAFLAEFRRGFQVDSEVFFAELTGIGT
jgi:HK97 family phage major capsid protein